MLDVPQPDQGIEEVGEASHALRALTAPGLRLFAAKELFDVSEGVLDGPPIGELGNDHGAGKGHVGGEEEVVFFLSFGISRDHQQDRGVRAHLIPQHGSAVNQTLTGLTALPRCDRFPPAHVRHHRRRARKSFPFLAGAAPLAGATLGRHLVDRSVRTYAADDMRARHGASGQGRIKPVSYKVEPPLGEPLRHVVDHLLDEVQEGRPALAIEAEVDRQRQGFAAPGRRHAQAQRHDLEPPRVDRSVAGGANRITAELRGAHPSAGLLVHRVVGEHPDRPFGAKRFDQHLRPRTKKPVHAPRAGSKETMIRVVAAPAVRIGERDHRRDRPARRTHDPSGDQPKKQPRARRREHRQKAQDHLPKCRDKGHRRSSEKVVLTTPFFGWCGDLPSS